MTHFQKEDDQRASAVNENYCHHSDSASCWIENVHRWRWCLKPAPTLSVNLPLCSWNVVLMCSISSPLQVNGVLCTQALLYAVGLGKGAIPTAAAVNWVLKVKLRILPLENSTGPLFLGLPGSVCLLKHVPVTIEWNHKPSI